MERGYSWSDMHAEVGSAFVDDTELFNVYCLTVGNSTHHLNRDQAVALINGLAKAWGLEVGVLPEQTTVEPDAAPEEVTLDGLAELLRGLPKGVELAGVTLTYKQAEEE